MQYELWAYSYIKALFSLWGSLTSVYDKLMPASSSKHINVYGIFLYSIKRLWKDSLNAKNSSYT